MPKKDTSAEMLKEEFPDDVGKYEVPVKELLSGLVSWCSEGEEFKTAPASDKPKLLSKSEPKIICENARRNSES